ncbi:MAG: ribonucleoside-diphosphate reductase subunit alpha [Gammaproteobacteria bacterium]|nr:ribonucleoside-diphosphate reductase subunit alpha [Gammaproteobacteria bacterium]
MDSTVLAAPATNEEMKMMQNNTFNTQPGQLRVIRRNGKVVPYDPSKLAVAITKAFLATSGPNSPSSESIHAKVTLLVQEIDERLKRRLTADAIIHIEDIQDQVELALMRSEERKVLSAYVLYREERRKAREHTAPDQPLLHVTLDDGMRVPLDMGRLQARVTAACHDLKDVAPEAVLKDVLRNLFDGVTLAEVNHALVLAARLLLDDLQNEALGFLGLTTHLSPEEMSRTYAHYFKSFIARGVQLERLDPRLQEFDLARLGQVLIANRDQQFTYLGLQTLYDRYFLHAEGVRYELPQAFFMRVAMGLALNEAQKNERAIEFYLLLSSFDYMSSTPTLFNSGTLRSQLSSCYLSTIGDDLDEIYSGIKDNALLSKFAGGLGNDWTPVRAMGSYIKGTNGKSQGVVPFMVVANYSMVAVNQGGKRKGAGCAYLETFHKDIKEFLELRKNTGDERRRTHDMNTANWIPDLFMKRVVNDQPFTLFSPDETPDLHDLYGKAFEKAYLAYEEKAQQGLIKNFEVVSAKTLWRKMLSLLFETGHPWVTFKDPCNIRSPQQHVGVVHSSNLCTEITLNTSKDEIAVCNLGSINLPAHIRNGELDVEHLRKTITTAVRMLDNVIDINFYPVPQAQYSNLRHRPVGLGLMGFQDALYKLGLDYDSEEAITFADRSMEAISFYAINASSDLAKERGSYESFAGSLWSQGILPLDSIELLAKARGAEYLTMDRSYTLDWQQLRDKVQKQGMRNSNVMAIAPTATISNIVGVSQSIEPTYQNLYVKSNLSGEFTVINPYLVNDLKALNLWDNVMVTDLKYFNGSVKTITRIPDYLKKRYASAFEVDPTALVLAGARRQKWIDQSQSLNLYMAAPSGKKLDELYRLAWTSGLKTTYYLRSLGATNAERSTIADGALNAVKSEPSIEPKACSIDDPDCEACQ